MCDATRYGTALALLLATGAPPALAAQAATEAAVDRVFAEWDRPDSPGCALGVVRDARLVYAKGYGAADLERGAPITPETVFYLASVSKQFTAATLALLALDGQLSLDDDVRAYVPELPDYDGTRITLRHLVHHTSGLRDYLELMPLAGMPLDSAYGPDEILALVARQRTLNFAPGDRYLYSNTGYFLIPVIVERVTGRSIREYAQARLFGPLDMDRTHFHDDYRHTVTERALAYRSAADGGFALDFLQRFDQVGSGGVLSTVRDLVRWDRNFSDGAVGGRALLDLLHAPGVLTNGDTLAYALGLTLGEYKGLRTVAHGGSMMGFRTHLLRIPAERFSVICLCNLAAIDPGALAREVADVYLAHQFAATLAPYAGSYRSDELEVTWALAVRDADLAAIRPSGDTAALIPAGRDTFVLRRGVELAFRRDGAGVITGFELNSGRASGMTFVKQ